MPWAEWSQANAEEPVEPDEPELPDSLSIEDIGDEDRVNEARNELISAKVQDAIDANPGL